MVKVNNPDIVKGIPTHGPGRMLHLTGKWRFVPKNNKKIQKKKIVDDEKTKLSKWYKADGEHSTRRKKKTPAKLPKLKKGLEPGRIVIILAGRYQGKRVVFLKQMEKSGLLLVTGPYGVNGVPLRRIPQSYAIVTSTKVDISGVKVPDEVTDDFFRTAKTRADIKRRRLARHHFNEENFFKQGEKPELNEESLKKKKAIQKQVDEKIVAAVKKVPLLNEYLRDSFGLRNNDVAHRLIF